VEAQALKLEDLQELEDDCLIEKRSVGTTAKSIQLHPLIHARLSRIRELPHIGVAHLYGVERRGAGVFLVWQHVEGQSLAEHSLPLPVAQVAAELNRAVEALHARGIVHGAINEQNVIVTPDQRIVLTRLSPLLYTDPAVDMQAVAALLSRLQCGSTVEVQTTMDADVHTETLIDDGDQSRRWAALALAALVLCIGLLLALGIWRFATRITPEPTL